MPSNQTKLIFLSDLEEGNSEFKPHVLCLKTDLVSHLSHGRGVG